MKKLFLSTILAACACQAAEGVHVYGIARRTCGQFLEDVDKDNALSRRLYTEYVVGYITGYNAYNQDHQISSELADATVIAYGKKYCNAFPLSPFSGAVMELAKDLGGKSVPWKK